MIYMVTFSIGRNSGNGTRGNVHVSSGGARRTIVVPQASSRGEALLLAAEQMKDEDVYSVKIDDMNAEILETK